MIFSKSKFTVLEWVVAVTGLLVLSASLFVFFRVRPSNGGNGSRLNLTEVYRNEKYGFEIRYPKGWQTESTPEEAQGQGVGSTDFTLSVSAPGESKQYKLEDIGISVLISSKDNLLFQKSPQYKSPLTYLSDETFCDTFKKEYPAAKVTTGQYTLQNTQGYYKKMINSPGGKTISCMEIIIDSPQWWYHIAPNNKLEEPTNRFESIAQTFRLLQ